MFLIGVSKPGLLHYLVPEKLIRIDYDGVLGQSVVLEPSRQLQCYIVETLVRKGGRIAAVVDSRLDALVNSCGVHSA